MARLCVFAEGQTEQTFVTTVVAPHLYDYGVYPYTRLVANAHKKRRAHRGGLRSYLPFKRDIIRSLSEDQSQNAFFTTMIDLYALPRDFPGTQGSESLRHLPYDRVDHLEEALASDINDPRFIPYIQLHEFEACLFSEPSQFGFFYACRERQIVELQAIVEECGGPERIDDGPQTAPSKRILRVLPEYDKLSAGPVIAKEIGLSSIRSQCPHLDQWLTRLEALAAGSF
ncbi:MAG: DUF4276 family protein [Planctomycetota bacterium]